MPLKLNFCSVSILTPHSNTVSFSLYLSSVSVSGRVTTELLLRSSLTLTLSLSTHGLSRAAVAGTALSPRQAPKRASACNMRPPLAIIPLPNPRNPRDRRNPESPRRSVSHKSARVANKLKLRAAEPYSPRQMAIFAPEHCFARVYYESIRRGERAGELPLARFPCLSPASSRRIASARHVLLHAGSSLFAFAFAAEPKRRNASQLRRAVAQPNLPTVEWLPPPSPSPSHCARLLIQSLYLPPTLLVPFAICPLLCS